MLQASFSVDLIMCCGVTQIFYILTDFILFLLLSSVLNNFRIFKALNLYVCLFSLTLLAFSVLKNFFSLEKL